MQYTKCACMRSYIARLTGCLCQGGTKSPLSPLCAIMLIVESNAIIISNECKSIVLSSGHWWVEGENRVFFCSLAHLQWLTIEMIVWEMVLDMIIIELIMQLIQGSVLWHFYVCKHFFWFNLTDVLKDKWFRFLDLHSRLIWSTWHQISL